VSGGRPRRGIDKVTLRPIIKERLAARIGEELRVRVKSEGGEYFEQISGR